MGTSHQKGDLLTNLDLLGNITTNRVFRVWNSYLLNNVTLQVGSGGWSQLVYSQRSFPPHGGYMVYSRGVLPFTREYSTCARPGWSTLLKWIPVGLQVCQLGWLCRSYGSTCKVLRHRQGKTQVKYPSGRVNWFDSTLGVTLTQQGGVKSKPKTLQKAGTSFHLGKRPRVRGVAMNPVDHPHGGGQGKTSGGRPGTTPWGRLTRGVRTSKKR